MSDNRFESEKNTNRERRKLPRLSVELGEGKKQLTPQALELINLTKEYLRSQEDQGLKFASINGMYYCLTNFIAFVGEAPVITKALLRDWVNHLRTTNKAQWTIVEWVKICKRFFRWLADMEYIAENPWRDMNLRVKSGEMKRETFTPQDYIRIRNKARGTIWYYAVVVGWHTGLRMIDVATLRWENIDFENQVVRVIPRKTRNRNTEVVVPFQSGSDLSNLLYKMKEDMHESGYLSPRLASLTSETRGSGLASVDFSRWLRDKCGIEGKTFHTFRRTFITNMMSSGVSAEIAMSMCGIKSRMTLDHYYVPNLPAMKKAMVKWRELTEI